MSVKLAAQAYGKSAVRVTAVTRHPDRHDLTELSVDILLEGDFADTYLTGDNTQVIPTDTMKNTVYALAASEPLDAPERFAIRLGEHFLSRHAHVAVATVRAAATPWQRIVINGGPHRHAFTGGTTERRTCVVRQSRDKCTVRAGLEGLGLLKTTDSLFKGFLRDEYTTLQETDDRIFATNLEAEWAYSDTEGDWNAWHGTVRQALIEVFAKHVSRSVQQTMYAMGTRVLDVCPAVTAIDLAMPNQHRIPVDLSAFGLENPGSVFVATSEPFGQITATIAREET